MSTPAKMLLHRFSDTPLLLHPRVIPEMFEGIRQQLMQIALSVDDRRQGEDEPPYDFIGGVAVIPVSGVLVSGPTNWFDESSYPDIANSITAAMEADDVNAVALQISSPGGEVSGLFDLIDTIHAYRGKKPMWSIVDDHAFSAAYAIAAATDRIVLPRTGGVGSIGVITAHFDISGLLEKYGVGVSLIHYGERKADYSPFKPLSTKARENLQTDVDFIGEMFVEAVSKYRSIDRGRVRSTEAATYMGQFGVDAGLADAVMSPVAAFDTLSQAIPRRVMGPNGPRMLPKE